MLPPLYSATSAPVSPLMVSVTKSPRPTSIRRDWVLSPVSSMSVCPMTSPMVSSNLACISAMTASISGSVSS